MSSSDPTIINSAGTASARVEEVGGKAASLFALARFGFRVPPFFVITARAYRRSIEGRLPETLRVELFRAWHDLGGLDHAYAVRSSGLAEDSAEFSYAGVFDTILEVRGEEALVEAIERCWASHRSTVAEAYRTRRGVESDSAMAVVVQRMVRADWSGVSFSANPLTQALSVCVVNATRGLGEQLVAGRINPEELHVDVHSGQLLHHRVPPGAEPLPMAIRDEVVLETCRAAQKFGFPQDLEWATEGGMLYLLQSRPITTVSGVFYNRALEPWLGKGNPDAVDRVWTRAYADEVWSPPLTPLFYDIQNLTAVTGQQLANSGDTAPVPPDVFKYYRAAAYMDVAVLERLYATLPPIARRPSLSALLSPERRPALAAASWNWRGTLRRLWKFEVRQGNRRGLTRNHRVLAASWPGFLITARRLCDTNLADSSDTQLDEFLGKVWELALSVAPECEVAVLYYAHDLRLLLTGLLERWCNEGEKLYAEVSCGLECSETIRETDAIWELAQVIRAAGEPVCNLARGLQWHGFRQQAAFPAVANIIGRFEQFLYLHRHRGANYKDLIYPRWGDDPELLWTHVQAFLAGTSPRPGEINSRSGERRLEAQRATLASLRGPFAFLKRAVLRALFRANEIYGGLRDNHRFYYDHIWWLVRLVYLEKGRRLTSAGHLAQPQDAMFLSRSEIEALREGGLTPALAATRIGVRRREWEETRRRPPPKFLRRGYVPDEDTHVAAACGEKMLGVPASPGQVRGRARVVLDVTGLAGVAAGEILVARQTDPGWTPAFARLAGLVLETGGVLAHGASLCREYGLPCVTAVEAATTRIADGDTISVSGSDGTVEILQLAQAARAESKLPV
jgi:phosphohistidine swiveling domain-containing protein